MINEEQLDKIESTVLNLISYCRITQSYVNDNFEINDSIHLSFLLDKMEEELRNFGDIFDSVKNLLK